MADFEKAIQKAIDERDIPGCVLHAVNRDASFTYTKSFGTESLLSSSPSCQKPLTPSTVMWIASCTKLMTSICALQLVERGLTTLDAPVYTHVPELRSFPVITGFDKSTGEPITVPHETPITLRHLLTHTSGLAYDMTHPSTTAWTQYHKATPWDEPTLLKRFSAPLVFEPGTQWMYGPSIDFAGLLIERISGTTLEDFMKQNLWDPLSIKDMTFHLGRRPDLKARMAHMSARDAQTGKVTFSDERMGYQYGDKYEEVVDCMGGQGVFASPEEYIKVVHALLVDDEEHKLLRKETLEEFFKPQLGEGSGSRGALNMVLQDEMANNAMGGTDMQVTKDWGLGGVLLTGESRDGKREGTMLWGGYPNLIWFVDRKTGLCGLYAGQVIPPGDAKCAALNRQFEAAIYEQYAKSRTVSSRL